MVEDKRIRILDAAEHLIVKAGLQCSMSAIAQSAKVATGSLYTYFPSKDAMILAVYERLAERVAQHLVVPINPDEDPKQRIIDYLDRYIDFIWQDEKTAILFEYLSNMPLIPSIELLKIFEVSSNYSNKIILEAQKSGIVRSGSSSLLASAIGGAVRNTLKWHRIIRKTLDENDKRQLIEICWSAIENRPL